MRTDEYINHLVSQRRYRFSTDEFKNEFNLSVHTVPKLLQKLCHEGKIISPIPSFHVIVPLERRQLKHVNVFNYIDGLMQHLNSEYYVGLMSAAALHGASHQAVMSCQVMIPEKRRNINYANNQLTPIHFTVKKSISGMDKEHILKKPYNYAKFNVSSPEATMFDLAKHPRESGGWNNIATIAIDMAEKINSNRLQKYANTQPISLVQKLGYIFEMSENSNLADAIHFIVELKDPPWIPLVRQNKTAEEYRSRRWKLIVNTEVEHDHI